MLPGRPMLGFEMMNLCKLGFESRMQTHRMLNRRQRRHSKIQSRGRRMVCVSCWTKLVCVRRHSCLRRRTRLLLHLHRLCDYQRHLTMRECGKSRDCCLLDHPKLECVMKCSMRECGRHPSEQACENRTPRLVHEMHSLQLPLQVDHASGPSPSME
jgi:hypothetical protein